MPMRVVPYNFTGTGKPAANFMALSSLHADYGIEGLYDGRLDPITLWAAAANISECGVRIPLDVLDDGGFESAASPTSWNYTADVNIDRLNDAGEAYAGDYSLKWLVSGEVSVSHPRQVKTLYASHYYEVRGATRAPDGTAKWAVVDLEAGSGIYGEPTALRWLTSAGVWTDTETWLGSTSADAWTLTTVKFQAPSFRTWGRTSGRVMIILNGAGNDVRFDGFSLAPAVDVAAVVGHNLASFATLGLYSGAALDVLEVSAACAQPVAFVRAPALVYSPEVLVMPTWPTGRFATRYPFMAELYVGQSFEIRCPRVNLLTEREEDQIRISTRGGVATYRDQFYPQRAPLLQFDFESQAQRDTAVEEWMLATEWGARPHLILPATEALPEACYFGLPEPKFGDELPHKDLPYYRAEVRFREEPIPAYEAGTVTPTLL